MSPHDREDPPRFVDDAEMPHGLRDLFARAQEDVPPLEALEPAWSSFSQSRLSRTHRSFGNIGIALGILALVGVSAIVWQLRPREAPRAPSNSTLPTLTEGTRASSQGSQPQQTQASQDPQTPQDSQTSPPASTRAAPEHDGPAPRRAPRAAPRTSSNDPPPIQDELAEGTLLLRARRALPTDPAAALAFVREHERMAPSGVLTPEREAIAVEALARLGRNAEARSRGERFLERWPTSAHRSRVERWTNP